MDAPTDPEVSAKAERRKLSAAYKRRILAEAERGGRMIACQELSKEAGTAAACKSLNIARSTYYRRLAA
jgi:hypothetical protein